MQKQNLIIFFLCIFAVSLLVGCATTTTKSPGMNTSWYGKSGAQPAPAKDPQMGGSWWMPEQAPAGKEGTLWGNRGYVYLAGAGKAPAKARAMAKKAAPKPAVCPPAPPMAKAEKKACVDVQDVYFKLDSAELTPEAMKTLDSNAAALKKYPKAKITLLGYASPEGEDTYNMKLSERRAAAVKDYLEKKGVAKSSISTQAKGKMDVAEPAYPKARKVHFEVVF